MSDITERLLDEAELRAFASMKARGMVNSYAHVKAISLIEADRRNARQRAALGDQP